MNEAGRLLRSLFGDISSQDTFQILCLFLLGLLLTSCFRSSGSRVSMLADAASDNLVHIDLASARETYREQAPRWGDNPNLVDFETEFAPIGVRARTHAWLGYVDGDFTDTWLLVEIVSGAEPNLEIYQTTEGDFPDTRGKVSSIDRSPPRLSVREAIRIGLSQSEEAMQIRLADIEWPAYAAVEHADTRDFQGPLVWVLRFQDASTTAFLSITIDDQTGKIIEERNEGF